MAAAQPGTRNAIVYGARAVGETDWHFGSFSLQSTDSNPLTFEIGVFFFRAQGYGLATCVYKTYVDGAIPNLGDSTSIVDDPDNGISPSDGRRDIFNNGAQSQSVFVRQGSVGQVGVRISSSGDTADSSAAGGISVKQDGPVGMPPFRTEDGILGYRFNVTLACIGDRTVWINTPQSRINSFATYNQDGSNISSEHKATTTCDPITLHASWVPAPATLVLLSLGGLFAGRRRRYS